MYEYNERKQRVESSFMPTNYPKYMQIYIFARS